MTDELLPALPKAAACIRKEALNYPDGKDDYLVWDADLANENDELIYTEAQMRAYAREAIRLSHTWPTLRDDTALPGGGVACLWTYDEDDYSWDSACGEKYCFPEGGPADNGHKFCHGCGNPLAPPTPNPHEADRNG